MKKEIQTTSQKHLFLNQHLEYQNLQKNSKNS